MIALHSSHFTRADSRLESHTATQYDLTARPQIHCVNVCFTPSLSTPSNSKFTSLLNSSATRPTLHRKPTSSPSNSNHTRCRTLHFTRQIQLFHLLNDPIPDVVPTNIRLRLVVGVSNRGLVFALMALTASAACIPTVLAVVQIRSHGSGGTRSGAFDVARLGIDEHLDTLFSVEAALGRTDVLRASVRSRRCDAHVSHVRWEARFFHLVGVFDCAFSREFFGLLVEPMDGVFRRKSGAALLGLWEWIGCGIARSWSCG